jgi:AraC family L-rhamnose operon transcriptional activator RhaR
MDKRAPLPRHRFTDLEALPISLRLGHFEAEILYWGFIAGQWWRNYMHVHSFFEVCYAFEGCGTFEICGGVYPVAAGQVFIAKPDEAHEIISSAADPLGIYFWAYTLVPMSNRPGGASEIDGLLDHFVNTERWVAEPSPTLERTLEALTEEIGYREAGYALVIDGLVSKLLLDTARAVSAMPSVGQAVERPARTPADGLVQKMIRYLRDNYPRTILIRDVAAQVNLSERHTNRLFQQVMGVSILEYLTRLRLEIASQLLLDQQLSVKEVAQAVGYPDMRYFATLFHRRTGLTPTAFRASGGTTFLGKRA